MSSSKVSATLSTKFEVKHVSSALEHYNALIEKFIREDWDGVALKAGKFVEAVTKALMLHCGKTLPANMRDFKAGNELRNLESSTNRASYSETVRIVIPKACLFIYEIVNNRGGRHDAGEIDANRIDAAAIVPLVKWILAELVRFSTVGGDIVGAAKLIDGVTEKVYPAFEKIDDRTYVSAADLGAPALALLLAYEAHPSSVSKKELEAAIVRHGVSKNAASLAINRNLSFFDDRDGKLTLRALGRQRAEEVLYKLQSRAD
jgi:hypothetical protein